MEGGVRTVAYAYCAWGFGAVLTQSWAGVMGAELCTGAGEDKGIANVQNRREISVSSCYDQSRCLHPHPYNVATSTDSNPGPWWCLWPAVLW
eukprot:COSAG01_NODE_1853_length_9060_cov_13.741576_13_plen_92_part_00